MKYIKESKYINWDDWDEEEEDPATTNVYDKINYCIQNNIVIKFTTLSYNHKVVDWLNHNKIVWRDGGIINYETFQEEEGDTISFGRYNDYKTNSIFIIWDSIDESPMEITDKEFLDL